MLIPFIEIILLSFLPVAILLLILAFVKKSSTPLIAAGLLLAAYAFDFLLRYLPPLFSFMYSPLGHYNWEGGLLSFLWPWPVIFLFNWLNAKEVGLQFQRPVQGILLGLFFGFVLGGLNLIDTYFFTELPSKNLFESIIFQLFVPALSEELIFRGIFLAILNRYLEKRGAATTYGWGIVLVSLLFISAHVISFNQTTGELVWLSTLHVLGNMMIATVVLGYLRLKTNSIWPGVICHSLTNSMPFIIVYLHL